MLLVSPRDSSKETREQAERKYLPAFAALYASIIWIPYYATKGCGQIPVA